MRSPPFPEDAPELELSRLLDEYRTTREKRHAGASGKARAAAGLLVVGLQQRLLSSIEAFARSLKVHRKTVERHWRKSQQAADAPDAPAPSAGDPVLFLKPPDADDERADWTGEEIEAEEKEQIEAITLAAEAEGPADSDAALWAGEQRLLDRMQAVAEETRHLPDAKTRRLIDWIREHLCPELPPFGRKPSGGAPPCCPERRPALRRVGPPSGRSGGARAACPGSPERLHEELVPVVPRKEIGKGLLAAMLKDLDMDKETF